MNQTSILSRPKSHGLIKSSLEKNILCGTFSLMLNRALSPSDTAVNCWTNASSLKEEKHHSPQLILSSGIIYAWRESVWDINDVFIFNYYSQRTQPEWTNTVCLGFPRACKMEPGLLQGVMAYFTLSTLPSSITGWLGGIDSKLFKARVGRHSDYAGLLPCFPFLTTDKTDAAPGDLAAERELILDHCNI